MTRFTPPKTTWSPTETEPKPIPERKTLHLCMVCQRQLTVPGERYCNEKKRDHRPKAGATSMQEMRAGSGAPTWKPLGSSLSAT